MLIQRFLVDARAFSPVLRLDRSEDIRSLLRQRQDRKLFTVRADQRLQPPGFLRSGYRYAVAQLIEGQQGQEDLVVIGEPGEPCPGLRVER